MERLEWLKSLKEGDKVYYRKRNSFSGEEIIATVHLLTKVSIFFSDGTQYNKKKDKWIQGWGDKIQVLTAEKENEMLRKKAEEDIFEHIDHEYQTFEDYITTDQLQRIAAILNECKNKEEAI